MTVEWTKILFSSADQPYVLASPSPAQRRHVVDGRTVGWVGHVARFITGAVERAAHAVYRRLCAEVKERFAAAKQAAKQAARDLEISKFIRHQLHAFGSGGSEEEGELRTVPLKARARAASTAEALFWPRRVLRGEV